MSEERFASAGALCGVYDAVDWAAGALGAPAGWSPALRAALDLVWATKFPATLLWGPDLRLLYNEAYVPIIGDKHPQALGAPAQEVFPEAWDEIGPMLHGVLAGGPAIWVKDAYVPLDRRGFLEECYFTFSYSAVSGGDGQVEGVLDVVSETTTEVLAARRLRVLGHLRADLADAGDFEDALGRALSRLHEDPEDFPVVAARRAGTTPDGPPSSVTDEPRLPAEPAVALGQRSVRVEDTEDGRVAWLALGPADAPGGQPLLAVRLSPRLAEGGEYLSFLRLAAAAIAQALDRAAVRDAERAATSAVRGLSEALQRSLLTRPQEPDGLHVAVRYLPAAEQAQVGGDWYDAFVLPDGTLTLVIGDVSGHDRDAAAAMAQVRNLLRGIAYTVTEPPARVLAVLDRAMAGLGVGGYATAVLAKVEHRPSQQSSGLRTVRWCNAGHLAPVLLQPDGTAVRLDDAEPDLLLGVDPDVTRYDHSVTLAPGAGLVLYTDGLIERRGAELTDGLAWLVDALSGCSHLSSDEIAAHVVDQLDGPVEDDIALLVLRVG